jgi:co-chaperonin GroES (HSP10)
MIRVVGHRLLIKPIDVSEQFNESVPEDLKNLGFKVALGDSRTERMHDMANERGILVGIGDTAWTDPALGGKPWAKIGDEVLFAKYAGKLRKDPYADDEYFIINDVDLQGVITKE